LVHKNAVHFIDCDKSVVSVILRIRVLFAEIKPAVEPSRIEIRRLWLLQAGGGVLADFIGVFTSDVLFR
jgi:hypothetical protein